MSEAGPGRGLGSEGAYDSRDLVVIKVGGDLLLHQEDREALAANLLAITAASVPWVLLHGGGAQVSALQHRLGLVERKVGGRRITGLEDLCAVEMALCGEVNVTLCAALSGQGIPAFGMHGASGGTIRASRRPPRVISGGGERPIDFGEVGDVEGFELAGIRALLGAGLFPVIASLGLSARGEVFNINADTTSVRLARALNASKLLLVTKVGGIFRDPKDRGSRISRLRGAEARSLIASGVIKGGMIPKVEEALEVLGNPLETVTILGVDVEDNFEKALQGSAAVGTTLVA